MKNLAFLFLVVVALGLVGCSGNEADLGTKGGEAGSAQSPEAQIQKIKDDPHMPQMAKDAAIGQIQGRIDAAKSMSEGMQKTKAAKGG